MQSRAQWRVTSGTQDPAAVARLLGLLPHWFGFEESNAGYVEAAGRLPTYLAWQDGARHGSGQRPAGVLLVRRHFPAAAEIYLLAVDPALHRTGAGRALVSSAEADLAADGVQFLQVKTLGPSNPDAGYALTRKFYLGIGFTPLEEFPDFWSPTQHCLIMVKTLAGASS